MDTIKVAKDYFVSSQSSILIPNRDFGSRKFISIGLPKPPVGLPRSLSLQARPSSGALVRGKPPLSDSLSDSDLLAGRQKCESVGGESHLAVNSNFTMKSSKFKTDLCQKRFKSDAWTKLIASLYLYFFSLIIFFISFCIYLCVTYLFVCLFCMHLVHLPVDKFIKN